MTNSKSTKGSLLASSISLLLCFAMLLGTTFAWFTDSAATGSNVITAGNLDVEVQYTLDGEHWENLDGATDLFQKGLWEPGHTEVVALKIKNNGTLALKYAANMNIVKETIGKTKDGKDIVLSDILTVSTLTQQAADKGGATNQVGDITLGLAFSGESSVAYQNTTTFKAGNVLGSDEELEPGAAHYLIVKVDMAETVGNEANHNGTDIPTINFGINVFATQFTYEEDSFGNDYDETAKLPDVTVYSAAELQDALNDATKDTTILLADNITEDIKITQKSDVEIVIDGNGKTISGAITLDGKSATIRTAGAVIQNVNFKADSINEDACIRLGDGTNATRYVCNVTVKNCTFDVPGAVGVKSYTGGDKNLTISNCTATARAHSLVQAKGIDGILVENCKVYSKNGMNFNNSTNVTVADCTADVKGYAVRFGESSGGVGAAETYLIKNCNLTSACDDGDAVIVLRGTADNSTLTIENTTLNGTIEITNNAVGSTVVKK